MSCQEARLALGGYVLGALEAGERREVTQHLATCGSRRLELADYDELPGLLDQVPIDDVAAEVQLVELAQPSLAMSRARDNPDLPVEQPSPELLDRLLRAIAGGRGEAVAPDRGPVDHHKSLGMDLHVTVT
jgi:anti-sigma factor RsiW